MIPEMPTSAPSKADTIYSDLSGSSSSNTENPYDAMIEACNNDPVQIQARYVTHRETRNRQYREKLLSSAFENLAIDPILLKLLHPEQDPTFSDPRHNLAFWARPPKSVRALVNVVQEKLLESSPSLWLMPIDCLHMTTLEIKDSTTEDEVQKLIDVLQPRMKDIVNYTHNHHARLVKPLLGFDASALALTFVPAAGEGSNVVDDSYSYHHLRRDLYALCKSTGVTIASRYTIPSSHITIARFVTERDFSVKQELGLVLSQAQMSKWIDAIERVNQWLQATYWPARGKTIPEGGQWLVGQERGLDCRIGTCWYGGGKTWQLGRGF